MDIKNSIQLPADVISFNNLKLAFKRTLKINDDLIIDHLNIDKAQGRALMAKHNLSLGQYRYLCIKAMDEEFPTGEHNKIALGVFKSLQRQVNQAVHSYVTRLHQDLQKPWVPQGSISIAEPKANYTERIKVRLTLDDAVVYQALANVMIPKVYDKLGKLMDLAYEDYPLEPKNDSFAEPKSEPVYRVLSNHLEPVAKLGAKLLDTGSQKYFKKFTYHCFQDYYPHWQKYESFYKGETGSPKLKERYLLKADFTAFYDCINHERLFQILQEQFEISQEICTALKVGFYQWQKVDQDLLPGIGLPQGYLASSLLSECYLYPFDLAMKDLAHTGYLIRRYVDDVAVITATKATASQGIDGLNHVTNKLSHYARALGLHLNQSKLSTVALKPRPDHVSQKTKEECDEIYKKNLQKQLYYHELAKRFNGLEKGELLPFYQFDLKVRKQSSTSKNPLAVEKIKIKTSISIHDLNQLVSAIIQGLNDHPKADLSLQMIKELFTIQEYYLYTIIPLFKKQNGLYYEGWLGSRISRKSKRKYDLLLFKIENLVLAMQKELKALYSYSLDQKTEQETDRESEQEQKELLDKQWHVIQKLYEKFLNQSGLAQLEQAKQQGLEQIKQTMSPDLWRSWSKKLLNAIRRRSYHQFDPNDIGHDYRDILVGLAQTDICQVGASLRLLNRYPHSKKLIDQISSIAEQYHVFEGVRYAVYEHLSDAIWDADIEFSSVFNPLLKTESQHASTIGYMGLVELIFRQDREHAVEHLQALKDTNEPMLRSVNQFYIKD